MGKQIPFATDFKNFHTAHKASKGVGVLFDLQNTTLSKSLSHKKFCRQDKPGESKLDSVFRRSKSTNTTANVKDPHIQGRRVTSFKTRRPKPEVRERRPKRCTANQVSDSTVRPGFLPMGQCTMFRPVHSTTPGTEGHSWTTKDTSGC